MSGYECKIATIMVGQLGLISDDPSTALQPGYLQVAKNISLKDNRLEKDFGSEKWNQNAMGTGVRAFLEFKPDGYTKKVLTVGENGRVYKYSNPYIAKVEVTALVTEPSSILTNRSIFMLEGGAEETSNDRKIFIFSGQSKVQVIIADLNTRRPITLPAADWTGNNQPKKGILYKNRMVAFMGSNLYVSAANDHEDFTGAPLTLNVYPGESDGIIDIFIFKERLFARKDPLGLYWLDDTATSSADWKMNRVTKSFGGSSIFCAQDVLDDVIIANNYGTLTSLKAAFQLGDVASADIISSLKLDKFVEENLSRSGGEERHCFYDSVRKIHYTTYRSAGGIQKDRLLQMSLKGENSRFSLVTKDQPECLGSISDVNNIQRPYYGAKDGFIYRMDSPNRLVGSSAFLGEFWIHHTDFSSGDPVHAENTKQFDFIEIVYIPTGNTVLTVEHYIDGRKIKSQPVTLKGEAACTLGQGILGSADPTYTFKTSSNEPRSQKLTAGGSGRRISIRCYNQESNRNFVILKINVYYRDLDQKQVDK